jgi:formiminoglutamase
MKPMTECNSQGWIPAVSWQGRVDDPFDPLARRWHQAVEPWDPTLPPPLCSGQVTICLIGLASDEGVRRNLGRTGTVSAPGQIRQALANLPWIYSGQVRLLDGGDRAVTDGRLEEALEAISAAVAMAVKAGAFPIVLGGGHETALANFEGVRMGWQSLGGIETPQIISFDAHFDLRPFNPSCGVTSGNSFAAIADHCRERNEPFHYHVVGIQQSANTPSLFQLAERLGVDFHLASHIDARRLPQLLDLMASWLRDDAPFQVSLCCDAISAAHAPGVSAPQPFGLDPELVLEMMRFLARSGRVTALDIAEVSPRFDQDNRTAHLVAVLLFAWVNVLAGITVTE